jgi:hypothetical protein
MKFFTLSCLLFLNYANAGTLGDAYRTVCLPIQNQPDVHECVLALRGHSYFEIRPLAICVSLKLNSDKAFCLKTIGDITYDLEETATCEQKTTDEDKIACLIQLGHNYYPEP